MLKVEISVITKNQGKSSKREKVTDHGCKI